MNLTEEFPNLWNNVIVDMILGTKGSSVEGRAARVEEARLMVRQATNFFIEVSLFLLLWPLEQEDDVGVMGFPPHRSCGNPGALGDGDITALASS